MDGLRIRLLGGFAASVDGREIPDQAWHLRKARNVLKLLALAPGHRLHREQIMDVLWPDLDGAAAANQLRKAVHEVRRVLDPDPEAVYRYVESGDLLRLNATWVDVEEFENGALRARRSGDPAAYERVVALYPGDLLPEDRYEEWAASQQQRLRSEFLAVLGEWAGLLEARGDLDGATAALRRVLDADAIDEQAAASLMRLHAVAGRRSEALRAYTTLCAALRADIGAEPGVHTQRLYEQIRAGRTMEPTLHAELWEQVGDLRASAGDAASARAAYESALAGSATEDRGRLHRKAAEVLLMRHDSAAAEDHLRQAERAPAGDAEAGRLLGIRATWLCEVGRYDDAQRAAEASLRSAELYGTPDDLASAHETLAVVGHFRGDWRAGLHSEIERLGAAGDTDRELGRIFDIHHCIGQYHLYGDGLSDDVEEYARRTLTLATERGAQRAQAFAWCLLGESLLLHGRWDEAPGCLERSVEIHAELGSNSGVLPWQRLAELAAARGDSAAAGTALRRGMAIAAVSPMSRHAWGRLYATAAFDAVERGDPGEAVRAVRAAAAAAARDGDCPSCSAMLNPVAAEAFAALGDEAGARLHAAAAERVAGMFGSAAWQAMAEAAHGSAALAAGATDSARARFQAAVALYDRAGQPFWAARSRAQAAAVAPGDPEMIAEAAVTFARLGAPRSLRNAQGMVAS